VKRTNEKMSDRSYAEQQNSQVDSAMASSHALQSNAQAWLPSALVPHKVKERAARGKTRWHTRPVTSDSMLTRVQMSDTSDETSGPIDSVPKAGEEEQNDVNTPDPVPKADEEKQNDVKTPEAHAADETQDEHEEGTAKNMRDQEVNETPAEAGAGIPTTEKEDTKDDTHISVQYELLKTLSTIDRGVGANKEDRARVKELVAELEELQQDAPSMDDELESALDGKWRLAYSSTFAGEERGSQGFTGAPGGGGSSLGSVYQRIDKMEKRCDNVVQLTGLPGGVNAMASLMHTYVVEGNKMTITFTGVTLDVPNPFGLPELTLGSPLDLLPEEVRSKVTSSGFQSGSFDTTYVTNDMRVGRGDRGELRVFVRDG